MTHHAAVIGHPIDHSLSPLIHRSAYAQLGLDDWDYQAIDVTAAQLEEFLASCDTSWAGLSVTAPLKAELLKHGLPDQLSDGLQAANTLLFGHPHRLYNTDVAGIVAALGHHGITAVTEAIVLGAGATARSTLAALATMGAERLQVFARTPAKAHDSLDDLAASFEVELVVRPWSELLGDASAAGNPAASAELLVSTVPVQFSADQATTLAAMAPAVFDISYRGWPTALSQAAQQADATSIDGIDLLVFQAIEQVRLMTGMEPEAAPLLDICRAAQN